MQNYKYSVREIQSHSSVETVMHSLFLLNDVMSTGWGLADSVFEILVNSICFQNTATQRFSPCIFPLTRIRQSVLLCSFPVFRGTIESQKIEGDKIRYEVRIQDTWRVDGDASRLLPKKASDSLPAYPVWAKIRENLIVGRDGRQMRCLCPDMELDKSYLFLTHSYQVMAYTVMNVSPSQISQNLDGQLLIPPAAVLLNCLG